MTGFPGKMELGSLFYYFQHKKSTIEEFNFLLKFCDVKEDTETPKTLKSGKIFYLLTIGNSEFGSL